MLLVFDCTAMQDLRAYFAAVFQQATTMKQFMWQPDLTEMSHASGAVYRCWCEDSSLRRLREIDPSDGSDS